MTPLTFVTWLWSQPNYRSKFTATHVNTLAAMIHRNYPHPHQFKVVTDLRHGFNSWIDVVPAWNDFATVASPYGSHQPSCYRRLRAFHPEIGQVFGERFVSMDLDTVIVGDLTTLFNRPDDFVIWKEQDVRSFYNGSMMMMKAGARPQVWERFNPETSPQEAKAAGRFGSDQGWLSHCLGRGEATWSKADGVYSYRVDLQPKNGVLPKDARITMWHGSVDPWSPRSKRLPWVQEHYR
jgi:hypothetical protein